MAPTNKTVKTTATEQLDIPTLREQILSTSNGRLLFFIFTRRLTWHIVNARYIRYAIGDIVPGYTAWEIVTTRKEDGSFHAAVVSVLAGDNDTRMVDRTLDTEPSEGGVRYETDVQALRELYNQSMSTLGAMRDRSLNDAELASWGGLKLNIRD
jgi:hypothetical protein